jgi:ribonuclease Z
MLNVTILGDPPNDNALLVVADRGKNITRMLFDCGADTLRSVPHGEVQAIDHVFLSHLHMDHISGFDAFFRVNFNRVTRENHIWVPKGSAHSIWHRFQGFWWSHAHELKATWYVHDVDEATVQTFRCEAHEAFSVMHDEGIRAYDRVIMQTDAVNVEAIPLSHHGLCLGFVAREPVRENVDQMALAKMGLNPGPWLNAIKNKDISEVEIDGVTHDANALRALLIRTQTGDSIAYLTDFNANKEQRRRIAPYLSGVQRLFAEAQYAPQDYALADKYHHSTVEQIAELAKLSGVDSYTLLHLSRRYNRKDWADMLHAAQAIFPNSRYIEDWSIEA